MLRRVVVFLTAGLALAPALPALASPEGEVAAALVSEESYCHYLDDELYAHEGDNRGFGPEHDLAQANIISLFASFGLTVTLEPFDYYGATYHNVVGTHLGTATPDQEYVIGAHYDSVDNPGADDNASGVALVLEAARVLSRYESDFTIRFVAFDREEQGL
ncbi:MAG: M28 family peptidase, partial [Phycisphaerales bacterium]